jgi:hypothetical protein
MKYKLKLTARNKPEEVESIHECSSPQTVEEVENYE